MSHISHMSHLSHMSPLSHMSHLSHMSPLSHLSHMSHISALSHLSHMSLRILVGAPRERAEPNVPANRTGGVYSCPITADQSECSRIQLTLQYEDLIEDMWLGVSVFSQGPPGGRVLVCGHRFVKLYGAFKLKHMIGRCYIRGNDLKYNHTDLTWQNPEQTCRYT
ncbi:hypothetical protein KUCAC02_035319 [Chaenocephalus aceratus]|nr:hypothetical protein KUCAC02_035319 [Chaenocephalus aceratus]